MNLKMEKSNLNNACILTHDLNPYLSFIENNSGVFIPDFTHIPFTCDFEKYCKNKLEMNTDVKERFLLEQEDKSSGLLINYEFLDECPKIPFIKKLLLFIDDLIFG
jgi:hypothetical protein